MPPPSRSVDQVKRIRDGVEPGFFPLDHSRMKRYEECPRWFKYEYIDKLGRVTGDAAELGSAAHTFQEVMVSEGIEKANQMARVMAPLSKSQEWMNAKDIIESIVLKKDYLYLAEKSLVWEAEALKGDEPVILHFKAKIDLLFVYPEKNTLEIIDGKSGRVVPNETELKTDVQGRIYSIATLETLGELGIEKVIFTQAQWKYGRLVTAEFAIEELKEFKLQVEAKGQKILNETEYKPNPGNQCHWCPFVLMCDAAQKMLPETVQIAGIELPPVITSDEDAGKIAQGVIHLEEIIKRFREAIRGYSKENKTVVRVGEGGYGFWPQKTLKIEDLQTLIDIAQEKHIDLASFLSFNNKTGKTLVKNHPEFLEGLVEIQYPRFDFKARLSEEEE